MFLAGFINALLSGKLIFVILGIIVLSTIVSAA